MDLQGRIVHTWSSDFGQPTAVDLEWTKVSPQMDLQGWHHVELVDNGDLLAIVPLHMLLRLDRRSRLRWVIQLPVHHDIAVDPAGQIVTLGVIKRTIQHQGEQMMILDNSIITLSAQGKILGQLSLFDALRASSRTSSLLQAKLDWSLGFFRSNFLLYYMWALMVMPLPDVGQIHALYTSIFDGSFKGSRRAELMFLVPLIPVNILHVNSVEILERGVGGLWRQGDLLICLREMNQVLVLERASGRVRWAWGADQLDHPHHPSLTREGHLLIFDNGMDRQRSRVIELDPRTRRIVWTYAGSRSEPFYSRIRGASQKLTNGNVLITDSERGRVIEVTRQGEIVWEFFNPDADNPWESGKRAPIYRMMRVPPPAFLEAERSRSR